MHKFTKGLLIGLIAVMTTACSDYRTIPVSKIGKVVDNSGVSKETYQPGTRDIGHAWRYSKKLVMLDTSVEIIPMTLLMRLADDQELEIEVLVKTQLNLEDDAQIDGMFGLVTPQDLGGDNYNIPLTLIYSKLGEDLVRRTLVEVVTPHSLESFQKERKIINDTVEQVISERFENTPLKLYTATFNKVTYPDSYINMTNKIKDAEKSVELKAAEEAARRARLSEEEASVEVDRRVRLAKAETIRLENEKTAAGLNPMLLEYRKMELEEIRLQVDLEFAKAAQKQGNNTIFYPMGQKPDYIETRMGQKN